MTLAERAWRWHLIGAAVAAAILLALSHDPRLAVAALAAPALSRVHLALLERHSEAPLERGLQLAGASLRLVLLALGAFAAVWLLRSAAVGLLAGLAIYPLAFLAAALRTEASP